ncbi:hypothetical protein GW7_06832 [Heterocephalus glaber]|uniref:Uncharacterized protein n=1 Tax=Heterocephalus glaber TaxID=10181 RepID=G5BC08_HETGA|nr:hypothetical protein GW7_06832 [Heterocephalus glaber]
MIPSAFERVHWMGELSRRNQLHLALTALNYPLLREKSPLLPPSLLVHRSGNADSMGCSFVGLRGWLFPRRVTERIIRPQTPTLLARGSKSR